MKKFTALLTSLLLAASLMGGLLYYLYVYESPSDKAVRAGVEAYNRTEYRRAHQLWKAEAATGNGEAMANISALYLSGNGVAQDFGAAYIWARLAKLYGAKDVENILAISRTRLSPEEIEELDERYRQECLEQHKETACR